MSLAHRVVISIRVTIIVALIVAVVAVAVAWDGVAALPASKDLRGKGRVERREGRMQQLHAAALRRTAHQR